MANFTDLNEKIISLIQKADETTGKLDNNLTSAMQSLIDGYGKGGGTSKNLFDAYAPIKLQNTTATGTKYLSIEIPVETGKTYYAQAEATSKTIYWYMYAITFDASGNVVSSRQVPKNYFISPGFANEGTFTIQEGERLFLMNISGTAIPFSPEGFIQLKIMISEGTERQEYEEGIHPMIPFEFGGFNAEKIDQYYEEWNLDDTSFVKGTTAPSSATSIKASTSNKYTSRTIDVLERDVVVIQKCIVEVEHDETASGKAQEIAYAQEYVTYVAKARTSKTSLANGTRRYQHSSSPYISHYTTSGVETYSTTSYGLYATIQSANVSSATANSCTIRASSPVCYARTSTSYETADNMKKITGATYKWLVEVYLVDSGSTGARAVSNDILGTLFEGMVVPTWTSTLDEAPIIDDGDYEESEVTEDGNS